MNGRENKIPFYVNDFEPWKVQILCHRKYKLMESCWKVQSHCCEKMSLQSRFVFLDNEKLNCDRYHIPYASGSILHTTNGEYFVANTSLIYLKLEEKII